VRKLSYAGAPMTPALCEQLAELLHPDKFVNHYGSTEVFTFAFHTDQVAKPGCAGKPGVFARLRLVRPDPEPVVGPGELIAPGQQGEIIVDASADEAFSGYWHRPDADTKALRDGWYFTGDLGERDDDGDLWVVGRVDDMINTGGENVYPNEIEDALARCPLVAAAAVAGLPDPRWGQAVTAFVVPADATTADGALPERIGEWLRTHADLAGYKSPKRVVVVDEIPKSSVGKILRRKLVSGDYRAAAQAGPET
jgi:2-furoate---CoA ligase